MTKIFRLPKTGLRFFDVSRTYGLALVVDSLQKSITLIEDYGPYYQISYNTELSDNYEEPQFLSLFAQTEGIHWREIFQTMLLKRKLDELVKEVKDDLVHNMPSSEEVSAHLSNDKGCGFRTIPQSLDTLAAKGFREPKRGSSYHEGKQLFCDKLNYSLACIGAAHISHWVYVEKSIVSMLPNPTKVILRNHLELQRDLIKEKLCNQSTSTVIAHYSIKLAQKIAERAQDDSDYSNIRYNNLVYNVMQKTGWQPKPAGGGRFSIDPLASLCFTEDGSKALDVMDSIFKQGYRRGRLQDVAFFLAEFLSSPNLDTYNRYIFSHVRAFIRKENRSRVRLYSSGALIAMMKLVKTPGSLHE